MKIEVSINLLKDFFDNIYNCNHCKYNGTDCTGKSCRDSIIETLIEKSKLVLDFDLAILELEKEKRKCTQKQTDGLLFAIEKLEKIKSDHLFMK
ncbi:MAG TPA: hypothetical protein VLZ72_10855 [Flavobacterium sp.]|nr:hypothetical protein [Flavobacterium sp.]